MSRPSKAGFAHHPAPGEPSGECDLTDAGTPLPLADLVGFQLRRAHMLFALHWQAHFRHGSQRITPVQAGMLVVIASRPGLKQAALARMMDVEGPTLVQSVDRLVALDLVERLQRPNDRRSYALRLTQSGHGALAAVECFVAHRDAELLADLSAEERSLLLDILKRIVHRGHAVIDALAVQPAPRHPQHESRSTERTGPGGSIP